MGTNGIDPVLALREREKCKAFPTKKIYKDSEEAWEAAISRTRETKINISPYACDDCGWFHLTSSDKVNDKVVPARVGISTTSLRKKTPVTNATIPVRIDIPPTGPTVPANFDARVKVLTKALKGKTEITTAELHEIIGLASKGSITRYMKRVGWYSTRGRNPLWKPISEKKVSAPIINITTKVAPVTDISTTKPADNELIKSIESHPAGKLTVENDPNLRGYQGMVGITTTAKSEHLPIRDAILTPKWHSLDLAKVAHLKVGELVEMLTMLDLELRVQTSFKE